MAMRMLLVLAALLPAVAALQAGVARVNATLPTGVPLAGYNHGARRVPDWPVPQNTKYTAFMTPSEGHLDPTWMRALVIDTGKTRSYFVTVDAIGADGNLRKLCLDKAQAQGAKVTTENMMLHASHTHSGPGAVSPEYVWSLAPATDVMVPELQAMVAESCAQAIIEAEKNLQDATIGVGHAELYNVTVNRRAKISPYVEPDSIDPHLGIIRIDDAQGNAMATVWNFAIHGTCWGPDQMLSNADIMGGVNTLLEQDADIGYALFINADAGDIDPSPESCNNKPNYDGAKIIADAVKKARSEIQSGDIELEMASSVKSFGLTNLNFTLARFENCTSGGPLDICTLCEILKCDINAHLNGGWLENEPRFTALRFTNSSGYTTLMVTLPGEALSALGTQVRGDGLKLGFDDVFLLGYSQNHMGYFCTPEEYDIGGYESQLTFWGYNTSSLVREGAYAAASALAPSTLFL